MKSIALLASEHCIASDIFLIKDIFNFTNTYWQQVLGNDQPLYQCQLATANNQAFDIEEDVVLKPKTTLEHDHDAIILIAGYVYDEKSLSNYIQSMAPAFDALRRISTSETLIATHCTGTFALAASGLLNGKRATTNWAFKDMFCEFNKDVCLTMETLVEKDGNILTGGATTAIYNLCLQLIYGFSGESIASVMSKLMLMDTNRLSQVPYMSQTPIINHKDELVSKVQHWLYRHCENPISLDSLSNDFAVTKRTLIRRFSKATGDTPIQYLQKVRVERCKRLLETTHLPLEDILQQIGYEDASSFRRTFSELTSLTPKQYRDKFNFVS